MWTSHEAPNVAMFPPATMNTLKERKVWSAITGSFHALQATAELFPRGSTISLHEVDTLLLGTRYKLSRRNEKAVIMLIFETMMRSASNTPLRRRLLLIVGSFRGVVASLLRV